MRNHKQFAAAIAETLPSTAWIQRIEDEPYVFGMWRWTKVERLSAGCNKHLVRGTELLRIIKFEQITAESKWLRSSGVYLLLDRYGAIAYVGKSEAGIYGRPYEHARDGKKFANAIGCILQDVDVTRIEGLLIALLKPKYNKTAGRGSDQWSALEGLPADIHGVRIANGVAWMDGCPHCDPYDQKV